MLDYNNVIMVGDFNVDLLSESRFALGSILFPLGNATRHGKNWSSSLFDYFITNNLDNVVKILSIIYTVYITYDGLIFLRFRIKLPKLSNSNTFSFRDFNRINSKQLDNFLTNCNWSYIYTTHDCNLKISTFTDIFAMPSPNMFRLEQ